MSEADAVNAIDAPLWSLESLRNAGAQRFDPARFHYMEALARRASEASGAVQPILQNKLAAALADYGERFMRAQKAADEQLGRVSAEQPDIARALRRLFNDGDYRGVHQLAAQTANKRAPTLLSELNRYIQHATQGTTERTLGLGRNAKPEMKSVGRFRETWSKIAAVDQVDRAIVRGPENAGPLNSHTLVLRSLAVMRSLSPDYLRRFVSHVDSLLWLEQQSQKVAPVEAKPARKTRPKK